MALDFSKLTEAVKSVAELAASHANLSAIAQEAKDIEAKVTDKLKAEFAALEAKAQSEVDGIIAALEHALSGAKPLTHAEAVGVTAVATALSDAISPTQPAAPAADAHAPVPPVAVGVMENTVAPAAKHEEHDAKHEAPADRPVPKTVEEYNEMRAKGLLP